LGGQGRDSAQRGADVDVNPLQRDDIVFLNDTDAKRAEIIRRFRLFTYHPDEMVTMMALASMNPGAGDFDPKLYQYGGVWVYPVGVLLKIASAAGMVRLVGDTAWYMDHPEAFGRFYIVARLYSVAWGIVGAIAIFFLVRRLAGGSLWAGVAGALCFVFIPVVVNAAHEAKPHLAGVVLILLAILFADGYGRTARRRWGITAAVLCGAAMGVVLSAWPIIFILPVVAWWGGGDKRRKVILSLFFVGLAGLVYFLTNPYVLINLVVNRPLLWSNLANTRRMFSVGPLGLSLQNAMGLIVEGASFLLVVIAAAGIVSGLLRLIYCFSVGENAIGEEGQSVAENTLRFRMRQSLLTNYRMLVLLAIPALIVLVQFVVFAAGQEASYGRFALLVDVSLAIVAVLTVHVRVQRWGWRVVTFLLLVLFTAGAGFDYLAGFIEDASGETSRLEAAVKLKELENNYDSMALWREPAPYSLPAVNLFDWELKLLPRNYRIDAAHQPADVLVQYGDDEQRDDVLQYPGYRLVPTRGETESYGAAISWANKSFRVYVRESRQ